MVKGGGLPDEHPGVPEVVSLSEVLLRGLPVGLLLEGEDGEGGGLVGEARTFRGFDVPVPGFRGGGKDAEGDQVAGAVGQGEGRLHPSEEEVGVGDVMVRREDPDNVLRVFTLQAGDRPEEGGGCVSRLRFGPDVLGRESGAETAEALGQGPMGDDVDVLRLQVT